MSDLIIAMSVFLLAHIIPSYRPLRARLVERMGEKIFMSVYGIISLFLFAWLLHSYLKAPYMGLWATQDWMRFVVLIVMYTVCVLLICTFSQPNPFSLGKGGKGFDPANPGIVGLTRHPAFIAFALWSFVHMLPNGDVASLLFFALMGALSLYGPKSLDDKRKAKMGERDWQELKARVVTGWPHIGAQRFLAAFLLYLLLFFAHEPVIGVMPYLW
ncbi:NnrU family protein [Terasakiella sp. SH-1]|uniref:NnrU family protein n=1 Tax=Terasakiella sp. SH-1 TaxID=2560057 RepID=UPI0010734999|nr:NnrU family protein [Terasakiella sp. SH-1]